MKLGISLKFLFNKLLLVVSALLLAGLGVGSFALGEKYHLPKEWGIALWIGLGFIWVVGRRFRSKLREPFFVPFFLLWLVVHTVGSVVALFNFTLLSVVPFTVIELAIGFASARWLFGRVHAE
jgi:hypothetical protein